MVAGREGNQFSQVHREAYLDRIVFAGGAALPPYDEVSYILAMIITFRTDPESEAALSEVRAGVAHGFDAPPEGVLGASRGRPGRR
jgi:hypothetical protein